MDTVNALARHADAPALPDAVPTMLDLCCGLGGASQAMRARDWYVVRLDIEHRFHPDIVADIRKPLPLRPFPVTLLWMSPPCMEFARESLPWCRTGRPPDLSLIQACLALPGIWQPRWWILENVRGAVPYLGPYQQRFGPIYLWGHFPLILCERILPYKMRQSGRYPDRRAVIPSALSHALARSIEQQEVLHG